MLGSSSDSSLPPRIGAGGGLVCESVGKADMLSAHSDLRQSRCRMYFHYNYKASININFLIKVTVN